MKIATSHDPSSAEENSLFWGVLCEKKKKKMRKKHCEAGSYQEECWLMLGESERGFSYSL